MTETAHAATPPTRTTTTTRAIRSPRDMTGMIIYLPPPDRGGGGSYGEKGASARVSRQGPEHVDQLREQDPRRSDRTPVRLPRRARAGRDRLRVSHASPRGGLRRGVARARNRERAVPEADPRRRGGPRRRRGDRARREEPRRDDLGLYGRRRRVRDADGDAAGRLAGAGEPGPLSGGAAAGGAAPRDARPPRRPRRPRHPGEPVRRRACRRIPRARQRRAPAL